MASIQTFGYQSLDEQTQQRLNGSGNIVRKLAVKISLLREKNPTDNLLLDRDTCNATTFFGIKEHVKQFRNDYAGDSPGTDQKCVESFNKVVANCRMTLEECKGLQKFILERMDVVILDDSECYLKGEFFLVLVQAFDSNINPYRATDPNDIHQLNRRKIAKQQAKASSDRIELLAVSGTAWNALVDVIQNYNYVQTIYPPVPIEPERCCCVIL